MAVCPAQITDEFTVTVGFEVTLTVAIAVLEQPEVVPVTVYEEEFEGETAMVFAVLPVFQEYVEAPVAVNVADWPEHIAAEFTLTGGLAVTLTVATAVFEQPAEVPVTV